MAGALTGNIATAVKTANKRKAQIQAQKETIKSNRVDTSLYIERGESEEVDTYCLLLEETELQIYTDNGVTMSLT